jgi:hypothetical protein
MLSVEVDGRPLENLTYHRVLSPVFSALLPEFNWLDVLIEFFDLGFDVTEGLYSDCVSDGYWIMLAPLSRGRAHDSSSRRDPWCVRHGGPLSRDDRMNVEAGDGARIDGRERSRTNVSMLAAGRDTS